METSADTPNTGIIMFRAGFVGTKDILAHWHCSYMSLYRWMKQGLIEPAGRRQQYYFRITDVDRLAQSKGYEPVNKWAETPH